MDNVKAMKNVLLLLLGVVVSVMGAMIWTNGGYRSGGLLWLGERYDIQEEVLKNGTESCIYDHEKGQFYVQNEQAELYLDVAPDDETWEYCLLELKNMNVPYFVWHIEFLDKQGGILYGNDYTIVPGNNQLKISVSGKVKLLKIIIPNQAGSVFQIEGIKFQQRIFDVEDFLKKSLVLFLFCIGLYLIIIYGKRIGWYSGVEVLQYFYIGIGNICGRKISSILNSKMRDFLQKISFTIMFLLTIIMNIASSSNYYDTGRYWVFGFGALWLFVGILFWEGELEKVDWNNGVCLNWMTLCAIMIISDILVMKSFSYLGYVFLLCEGFAFFIWHNGKNMFKVLNAMLKGLEWTLPVVVLYCIFFRSKRVGILYNGCFPNRESMSMYALALFITFLAEGRALVCQKEFYWRKIFICGIGTSFSAFFLYYSDTVWCNIMAFVVFVIWGFDLSYHQSLWRSKMKKFIILGSAILLYSLALILGIKYLLKEMPSSLGRDIVYKNEVWETKLSEEMMYMLEAEQPGWLNDVTRDIGQDRRSLWREYIQKLNLIGNSDNIRGKEHYLNPSNGILQMAHRYGMFIWIPYFGFLFCSLYGGWKKKNFLLIAVTISFLAGFLLEDLEIPFSQPLWIMFYLEIGIYIKRPT